MMSDGRVGGWLLVCHIVTYLLVFTVDSTTASSACDALGGNANVSLTISPTTSAFQLNVGGTTYFTSGDVAAFKSSVHDGTLVLQDTSSSSGSDGIGSFDEVLFAWLASTTKQAFHTSIRCYRDSPTVVFSQVIVPGGPTGGTVFPAFVSNHSLGVVAFSSFSCNFMASPGTWPHAGGGHMSVFDPVRRVSFGMGPLVGQTVMSQTVASTTTTTAASGVQQSLQWGLPSSFTVVPANFTLSVLLSVSTQHDAPVEVQGLPPGGPNAGFERYGTAVLAYVDKRRAGLGEFGPINTHLGYSTTASYFYNACDCRSKYDMHTNSVCDSPSSHLPNCHTYADTLNALEDSFRELSIPVQHYLVDSWWYGEGIYGGVSLWEDSAALMDAVKTFPNNSFAAFYDRIKTRGASVWAHQGKFVDSSPYMKTYPFSGLMPQGEALYDHLFQANSQTWGLQMLKIDHVTETVSGTPDAQTNTSVTTSWLSGMGNAAAAHSNYVLYCCSPPLVVANGVNVKAAKMARASPDYLPDGARQLTHAQWAVGPTAGSTHWLGLGLLGYKDTVITNSTSVLETTESQWAGYQETGARLHLAQAVFSGAPVTFSDLVGAANMTLLRQAVNAVGLILKPSRPAVALDAQFYSMAFGAWPAHMGASAQQHQHPIDGGAQTTPNFGRGEVYQTVSTISTNWTWTYIIAAQVPSPLNLTAEDVAVPVSPANRWAVYKAEDGVPVSSLASVFSTPGSTLEVSTPGGSTYGSLSVYVVCPVIPLPNGSVKSVTLVGETGKLVPVSPNRVESITVVGGAKVELVLVGSHHEVVELQYSIDGDKVLSVNVTIGLAGAGYVTLPPLAGMA